MDQGGLGVGVGAVARADLDTRVGVGEHPLTPVQAKRLALARLILRDPPVCDRIAVMAEGQICELGTHEELLASGGQYARM